MRIFVLIRALIVGVEAEVDIEPAVAIVVGGGRAGERSLRRIGELKRVGLEAKFAAALIQEQQRTVGAYDDQILPAVVVEVGENRAGRIFEQSDSGRLGDVLERSVAAIAIEPVGKAGGLADVEIVEAVAIDVADRNAVVAVDVDAAGAIENRAPIIDAAQHLFAVGRSALRTRWARCLQTRAWRIWRASLRSHCQRRRRY